MNMTRLALIGAALLVLGACGSQADDTADQTVPTGATEPDVPAPTEPPPTGPDATEPAPTEPAVTEPVEPEPTEPAVTEPVEPEHTEPDVTEPQTTAERLAQIAIDDLVERIGVGPDDITVVSVDEVTWRDASLGCPRKGFDYAQVLTPGIRIVLAVDDTEYRYHGGNGQDPFYCAAPEAPLE